MKILMCISHVPDTNAKLNFTSDAPELNGVSCVIGPYDDFALARAVEIKTQTKGKLTILNVGDKSTEPSIRKALAIGGDDAIRVDAQPTDSFFVAKQIAEVAKNGDYDLILMGRESSDYNGGVVHGMVASLLGLPCVVPCTKLDVEGDKAVMQREIDGGKEVVEAQFPFIAGCQEPIAEWKIPNMRGIMMARRKPLKVVAPVEVDLPTQTGNYSTPPARSACQIVDADNLGELVRLLKEEAKVL